MARTTLDIDHTILRAVRRIARAEGKSLGQVLSELAARALADRGPDTPERTFAWVSRPMEAKVDLEDADAVHDALDRS